MTRKKVHEEIANAANRDAALNKLKAATPEPALNDTDGNLISPPPDPPLIAAP